LRALGLALPFCDGIGVPKTRLTATERQVRELFERVNVKVFSVVHKEESWFVKLDEDAAPSIRVLKRRLLQMSDTANEELRGDYEFTGFFYCQNAKEFVKTFNAIGLKQCPGYHSNSLSLNL
jgi:hypothetical protein